MLDYRSHIAERLPDSVGAASSSGFGAGAMVLGAVTIGLVGLSLSDPGPAFKPSSFGRKVKGLSTSFVNVYKSRDGEYAVHRKYTPESAVYYTDDKEDARLTALRSDERARMESAFSKSKRLARKGSSMVFMTEGEEFTLDDVISNNQWLDVHQAENNLEYIQNLSNLSVGQSHDDAWTSDLAKRVK